MESSKQYGLNEYARNTIRHKARQLIGKYGFTRDDYEDLTQEMAVDLLTRLSKFDPAKAGPNTFVARIIDRKISSLIRHRKQRMRDFRRQVCSLDDPIEGEDCSNGSLGETISQDEHDLRTGRHARPELDRIDLRLDVCLAISSLPPDLRVLAERLVTQSITETAHELGVPRSTLYEKGIARLRKAFEDKGLNTYL